LSTIAAVALGAQQQEQIYVKVRSTGVPSDQAARPGVNQPWDAAWGARGLCQQVAMK